MYVCRDWEPRNEYTTPIRETPVYRNSGIIKAVTGEGEKIQVGKITYEAFENEEFQYIITPFWEIVDMLSADIFQGIPGIDMNLRLEHYYRVNYVPVFMTERTPGPNREDLWELLDSVGLDYYDRLEWLIRTELRAAVDNLIVERAREETSVFRITERGELAKAVNASQYGDIIEIDSLRILGRNSKECTKMLNRLMHYGVCLKSLEEKLTLDVENYSVFWPVFAAIHRMDVENQKALQGDGIEKPERRVPIRGAGEKRLT